MVLNFKISQAEKLFTTLINLKRKNLLCQSRIKTSWTIHKEENQYTVFANNLTLIKIHSITKLL